jgi:hypothetical protein
MTTRSTPETIHKPVILLTLQTRTMAPRQLLHEPDRRRTAVN